jgi:hypothetical protein
MLIGAFDPEFPGVYHLIGADPGFTTDCGLVAGGDWQILLLELGTTICSACGDSVTSGRTPGGRFGISEN